MLVGDTRERREKEALCDDEPDEEGEALTEEDAERVSVCVGVTVVVAESESALRDGVPLDAAEGDACDALTLGEPLETSLPRSLIDGLWLALGEGVDVAVGV